MWVAAYIAASRERILDNALHLFEHVLKIADVTCLSEKRDVRFIYQQLYYSLVDIQNTAPIKHMVGLKGVSMGFTTWNIVDMVVLNPSAIWIQELYRAGIDFHQFAEYNGQLQTPLFAAVQNAERFFQWLKAFTLLQVDINEFVRLDFEKSDVWKYSGWTKQALIHIHTLDLKPFRPPEVHGCDCCDDFPLPLNRVAFINISWKRAYSRFMRSLYSYSTPKVTLYAGTWLKKLHLKAEKKYARRDTVWGPILYNNNYKFDSSSSSSPSSSLEGPEETSLERCTTFRTASNFFHDVCDSCWQSDGWAKPYCHWQYEFEWLCGKCWLEEDHPAIWTHPYVHNDFRASCKGCSTKPDNEDSPFLLSLG